MNQESMLVGSTTQVVVRGQLFVCGRPANLKHLTNVKLVLESSNYIDGVPLTKTFPNLSFSKDSELTVEF